MAIVYRCSGHAILLNNIYCICSKNFGDKNFFADWHPNNARKCGLCINTDGNQPGKIKNLVDKTLAN